MWLTYDYLSIWLVSIKFFTNYNEFLCHCPNFCTSLIAWRIEWWHNFTWNLALNCCDMSKSILTKLLWVKGPPETGSYAPRISRSYWGRNVMSYLLIVCMISLEDLMGESNAVAVPVASILIDSLKWDTDSIIISVQQTLHFYYSLHRTFCYSYCAVLYSIHNASWRKWDKS